MEKKVTIILACYNKETYIRNALDSIIRQSRFLEMEVIIIDDGSKDNSVNIIKEYQEKYENINLIAYAKGSGSPSKPRNTGIDKSTCDYIIFMDPDDMIYEDGYSVLLTKMEQYKSDILIGTRIGVNDVGQEMFVDFIVDKPYVNSNDIRIKYDLLNQRPFILKTIYNKKLIIDNNIRFNERISTSEDEIFDMTCVSLATKITKINDIVYQYTFESEGSITTKVSLKVYEELYDVMLGIEESLKNEFNQSIISFRILRLLDVFYYKKMPYMSNVDDVAKACKLVHNACSKYGFDRLEQSIVGRHEINILNHIKDNNHQFFLLKWYNRRIKHLVSQIGLKLDELNEVEKENRSLKRIV